MPGLQQGIDPQEPLSNPRKLTLLKEEESQRNKQRSTCKYTEIQKEEMSRWITLTRGKQTATEQWKVVTKYLTMIPKKLTEVWSWGTRAQKLDAETTEKDGTWVGRAQERKGGKEVNMGQRWKQNWKQQQGRKHLLKS